MRRFSATLVILTTCGCGSPPPRTPRAIDECADFVSDDANRIALFDVVEGDDGPIVQGQGMLHLGVTPGATFAIVDDAGFVGLVAAGERIHRYSACYDAPCPSEWRTRWVELPSRATSGHVTAIGPKGERFRKARRLLPKPMPGIIAFEEAKAPSTSWVTDHAYDIDGDGVPDIDTRARCCSTKHGPRIVWELRERNAVALRVSASAASCASNSKQLASATDGLLLNR